MDRPHGTMKPLGAPATEEQVMEAPHPVECEDCDPEPTTDDPLDPTPVE